MHWPGDQHETFDGLRAGRRYRLIQSTGKAEAVPARKKRVTLSPSELEASEGSARAAVRLASTPVAPVPRDQRRPSAGRALAT